MTTRTRLLRRVSLGCLALLLGAQFIRSPMDNRGVAEGPQSLAAKLTPPAPVLQYLREACYDCHSDHSRYPWYAYVQPVGWVVARHIQQGKRAINLSTFGTLGTTSQISRLEWMLDDINEGEMPDWSYRLMHPNSKLTPTQLAEITDWMQKTVAAIDTKGRPVKSAQHPSANTPALVAAHEPSAP